MTLQDLQSILSALFAWTGIIVAFIAAAVAILEALADRSLPAFGYGLRKQRLEQGKFKRYLEVTNDTDKIKFAAFVNSIREMDASQIKSYLDGFYDAENSYIRRNKDLTASIVLEQLGLKPNHFPEIKREIVRRAQSPITNAQDRTDRVRALCCQPQILVDTAGLKNPQYTEVRYFLNFGDAMFDESVGRHLANLLADLVREKIPPEELCDLTVAIPESGNFLLGCFVAQRLNVNLVAIKSSPRLEQNQYWDGQLKSGGQIVIIHDVTVSGARLLDAARKIRNGGADVIGVFTLVERKDMLKRQSLDNENLPLFSVLSITEEELAEHPYS